MWASRLDVAEASQPSDFTNNGWVVEALQGAWSAITTTPIPQDDPATGVFRVDHLRLALDAAVRGGGDTDTVAAIAGGLLGAAYGASAVPAQWRRVLHGWPGLGTRDLVALATRIVKADKPFSYDIDPMTPVRHPHDDGVWLGDVATLRALPPGVDAVVSLCRVHDADLPVGVEQIDVRLIDDVGPDANANLDFVLIDTVRLIEQLRNEGRCAWRRKPRSRPSIAPHRCFRCCPAPRHGPATTMSAMAPPACTPRWTWPAARSSDRCTTATARPSSWRSCAPGCARSGGWATRSCPSGSTTSASRSRRWGCAGLRTVPGESTPTICSLWLWCWVFRPPRC